MHLDATYRAAVAILLRESKYPREPITGMRHVAIDKMRKHGGSRHGTVIHGDGFVCESRVGAHVRITMVVAVSFS